MEIPCGGGGFGGSRRTPGAAGKARSSQYAFASFAIRPVRHRDAGSDRCRLGQRTFLSYWSRAALSIVRKPSGADIPAGMRLHRARDARVARRLAKCLRESYRYGLRSAFHGREAAPPCGVNGKAARQARTRREYAWKPPASRAKLPRTRCPRPARPGWSPRPSASAWVPWKWTTPPARWSSTPRASPRPARTADPPPASMRPSRARPRTGPQASARCDPASDHPDPQWRRALAAYARAAGQTDQEPDQASGLLTAVG